MRVNEIFKSIQGEGIFSGHAAIFVRLSKCNLSCDFCDTIHQPYKELTEDEIMQKIEKYGDINHIVITGGEPTLQLTDTFLEKLNKAGKFVQIETNGTKELDEKCMSYINWITCSPKFEFCKNADVKIQRIDELKVVYNGENDMALYKKMKARAFFLQPCDTGDKEKNKEIIRKTVEYCLSHPKWDLSLQIQKIINVR